MKFYKNFIVYWSVLYLVLAIAGRSFSSKKEWFPFFRWSLYSKSYNNLNISYVMVSKFGDSVFGKPKRLKELKDIHKLSAGDIHNEYERIHQDFVKTKTFNNLYFKSFFPEGSEYIMYRKYYDLRKEEYTKPIIKKLLEYKNGKIMMYDQ